MSTRYAVRRATGADAAAIGTIHVAAWRATYRGIMADGFLDGIDEARVIASWETMLRGDAVHEGHWQDLVVTDTGTGTVVGWCGVGAARDTLVDAKWEASRASGATPFPTGQLWAINVDPGVWDTGAAHLWVAEASARARRFYEREGWVADGLTQCEELGGAPIAEVRYVRSW